MTTSAEDQEFMRLKSGVGLVPPGQRNQAYRKLDYGPGEGGIVAPESGGAEPGGNDAMQAFLAGVAAGADPQQLAKELRSPSKQRRRGRQTESE